MPEFAVGGGERIYYVDEGSGPDTIVFSHGLLWSGEMFRPQIDALKDRFRCVAFDHRGQGQSPVARSGYDMDTLTADAAALIEGVGAAPCHFVGLSMGGFVGMRLAARRPELLRSLLIALGRIITTITEGDNHETLTIKHNARAKVEALFRLRHHLKKHLHVGHRGCVGRIARAAELAARNFSAVVARGSSIV